MFVCLLGSGPTKTWNQPQTRSQWCLYQSPWTATGYTLIGGRKRRGTFGRSSASADPWFKRQGSRLTESSTGPVDLARAKLSRSKAESANSAACIRTIYYYTVNRKAMLLTRKVLMRFLEVRCFLFGLPIMGCPATENSTARPFAAQAGRMVVYSSCFWNSCPFWGVARREQKPPTSFEF